MRIRWQRAGYKRPMCSQADGGGLSSYARIFRPIKDYSRIRYGIMNEAQILLALTTLILLVTSIHLSAARATAIIEPRFPSEIPNILRIESRHDSRRSGLESVLFCFPKMLKCSQDHVFIERTERVHGLHYADKQQPLAVWSNRRGKSHSRTKRFRTERESVRIETQLSSFYLRKPPKTS